MDPSDDNRRRYGFVLATFSLLLAVLFAYFVSWLGYIVVVGYFAQDQITFWVAIAIAILIWFIEEMLHLTVPCRRALRRLAHWMAKRWLERRELEYQRQRTPKIECDQPHSIRPTRTLWPSRSNRTNTNANKSRKL